MALKKMVKKGTNVDVVFTSDAPQERVLEYARETSLSDDPDDIRAFVNDYHQTNKAFRGVLASSLVNYKDQVEIVKQRKIPSLVTFGADEKSEEQHNGHHTGYGHKYRGHQRKTGRIPSQWPKNKFQHR